MVLIFRNTFQLLFPFFGLCCNEQKRKHSIFSLVSFFLGQSCDEAIDELRVGCHVLSLRDSGRRAPSLELTSMNTMTAIFLTLSRLKFRWQSKSLQAFRYSISFELGNPRARF